MVTEASPLKSNSVLCEAKGSGHARAADRSRTEWPQAS